MAPDDAARTEILRRRQAAYAQVVSAPGWTFVLLDLLGFCVQTPSDVRSAGRYDVVARLLSRAAEGPIHAPEVKSHVVA